MIVLACVGVALGCEDSRPSGGGGDSGTAPADGGGAPVDGAATADGGNVGVMCGDAMCGAGEVCCVSTETGSAVASCTLSGTCNGTIATCDGPEDCGAGEACCANYVAGGGGAGSFAIMCTDASMECTLEACHTGTDCSEAGAHCCPYEDAGRVCQRAPCT